MLLLLLLFIEMFLLSNRRKLNLSLSMERQVDIRSSLDFTDSK